jgi:hypothetical protein
MCSVIGLPIHQLSYEHFLRSEGLDIFARRGVNKQPRANKQDRRT